MKHYLLLLICFGSTVGKHFRGDFYTKFQHNPGLKEVRQDPHHIAGETNATVHTHVGDVAHRQADGPTIEATAFVLQRELANGMRKDFNFIREAMMVFAGPDGFVREGIIFCNPKGVSAADLSTAGVAAPPGSYNPRTTSLTPNDGFGDLLNVTAEETICGNKNCEEGSFVNILSNRIRSLGYHATHEDICSARVETTLSSSIVPQARTCKLAYNPTARKVRACKKTAYDDQRDFFQMNEKCYQVNEKNDCEDIVDSNNDQMCTFDTYENLCHVSYTYIIANMTTECPKDKTSEDVVLETSSDYANEVRRVMAYSVKTHGPVLTTDKAYVTGVTDGLGCRSLRQYVAAINGMAQINSFRDTGIIEGGEYWHESIRETRSYIESYADILNDFYHTSTKIFPLIEFEDVEECPVGNVEINTFNLGLEIAPLCDNSNFATRTKLNTMSFEAQTLARSECFCRMGQLSTNNGRLPAGCDAGTPVGDPVTSCDGTCDSGGLNDAKDGCVDEAATFTAGHFTGEETDDIVDSTEMYEADEVYLIYDDSQLLSKCNSVQSLESVYHYCKSSYTETRIWKDVLEDLEPNLAQIKHHRQHIDPQNMIRQMQKTMNLVSSSYAPTCGRLITSSIEEHMYSNKGGNCVPFEKLNEILYRLEYETSAAESGKIRGDQFTKFKDGLCKIENKLENTYYTFRQLAYQWDHAMKKTDLSRMRSKPVTKNTIATWENYKRDQDVHAENVADRLYWRDAVAQTIPMCFVDWVHEITGDSTVYDAAGTVYEDPYSLFAREIEEAIFNVDIAKQTKLETVKDHELLWAAIEEELTSMESDRLNYQISLGLAKHFMRIVTTDSDDNAVDNTDLHADGAQSETPNEITAATGSDSTGYA
tara:strand:- start:8396 stop:11029 length:2634 start_codon:yes stop_codon:yes gene_type:complete